MKSYLLAFVAVLSICAVIVASEEKRPTLDETRCDRLEKLEAEVAKLRKESVEQRSKITLKSPDGKRSISLVADNTVAGIWVQGDVKREGCVAIYSSGSDGAVMGLYGVDGFSKPMAWALSAKSPGSIQFASKSGQLGFYELPASK